MNIKLYACDEGPTSPRIVRCKPEGQLVNLIIESGLLIYEMKDKERSNKVLLLGRWP